MKVSAIVLAGGLALGLSCTPRIDRTLVWSDEFDAAEPDTTQWVYDLGNGCPDLCGWGNNELQYYTRDSKNVRIEDGHLIIEAHWDDSVFTSGKIKTAGKGDWKYGRIEVRAKLPSGKGTWPAIWMLSTDWKYGGWPASGEIDIMEHVGYDPGRVHGTLHSEKYNHIKQTQQEGIVTVADCQEVFHVYAIEWTEDRIQFFVDEQMYHEVIRKPEDDYRGWPFDQPFHLILNQAVGGNWGGALGVDDSIWPQRLVVDYVRVFQP
ncbi:MAG: family 16 glycosylhydrolase [Cyclobacteriaceae bacterium]